MAATRLVLLVGFLTFGCSAEPPPAAPPASTSPPPSSTMAVADPALVLSQLEMIYGSDLSACPTGGAACGEAITNVGEIADAMIRIVGENPSMEHRDEIASVAEELGETVDTLTESGCYGLGAPAGPPADVAALCDTLVQGAQLQWLMLGSAADGL